MNATGEEGGVGASKEWRRGICGICPAGCWVETRVEKGRLVDIRPDRTHPLGMICRRGEHAAEIVHSEHRLRHPLRRTGPKGTHEFTPITWDEAYDAIVEGLQRIKADHGPEAVGIYTGRGAFELSLCDMFQPRGVAVSSASNVLFPFGSPNTFGAGAHCYVAFAMIAPHVTMGRMLVDMFADIEGADLLVVWGTNPATDSPPLDMHRLEAAARRGAEIVVIDPRRTEAARRCDAEWIPIRPGSDGALALGILQVMFDEELFDEDFAAAWCHGVEELAQYAQHFSPPVVEEITGVPAATVTSLARRICAAPGACPVMYTGLEYSNTGVQAIRAVHTLFALAGHLDAPGGIGLAMRDSHFPVNRSCNQPTPGLERAISPDAFPIYSHYRHEPHACTLPASIVDGEPYAIRGMIVHGASLLTSSPQTPRWRAALEKLEFLVCIDRQLTADAAYADIVLPATTMFENESYMTYGPLFRLRERVLEPVGEARNDYLIMAELAHRLGYGELYPQSEEELVRFALDGSGFSLEDVKESGGSVKLPGRMMEYRKWEKGGLRPYGAPGFDTPTGKFEVWSTVLEDHGYEPLPKYTEPTEGPCAAPHLARDFPLVFNSGSRPQTDFRSQHHGIVGLVKDHPEPTVDLNTADAAARGVRSGDLVEVRTPRGAVPFRARVTDDIVRGAIDCSQGAGGPVGPKAWREWNVNLLTDGGNFDQISGFPVYKALLCEVTKLADGDGAANTGAATCTIPDFTAERPPLVRHDIYLDNSATTRVADEVREEMLPHLAERHGNPSSLHSAGRGAREAVEKARRRVASLLHARARRILFTGGGSEANNLALKGGVYGREDGRRHVITSRIEHPSVLQTVRHLAQRGCDITYLGVDEEGMVSPAHLRDALREDTAIVSIMLANNEVGTIQPIAELAALARARGALFHCDAVQAVGKIPVHVEELGVDLLSLSGHKFHGPQGVGALYVRKGVVLEPLIHGGSQERRLRAGTENVPAIVGLGRASELAARGLARAPAVRALRDRLEEGIRALLPAARRNGHAARRLPNILNLTLPGIRGESLVVAMDAHGIAFSSGSACKAGSPAPTHVLMAMGRSEEDAHCAVRFSLALTSTAEEIEDTIVTLDLVLRDMEATVRFLPCK